MHDLQPITALGGTEPAVETLGGITIAENPDLALASVAARLGQEQTTRDILARMLDLVPPGPGRCAANDDFTALWTGPDQWMIAAGHSQHELIAQTLGAELAGHASVTEQSGAWVRFDISGADRHAMLERLTALPVRRMQPLDGNRTRIEQLGCFLICRQDCFVVLGPRASAQSLHHSLITAARSVT